MANVCSDTVVLFPKEDTPGNAVSRLKEDLLDCYPSMGIHADTRLVLLLERLNIPTDGICFRGDVVCMDIEDAYICLELETAWNPLYDAYQKDCEHYGLDFVLRAEEPGERIFINTDVYGVYLDVRYRVLLKLDADAGGTVYEKMLREETDMEIYFSMRAICWNGLQSMEYPQAAMMNWNADWILIMCVSIYMIQSALDTKQGFYTILY